VCGVLALLAQPPAGLFRNATRQAGITFEHYKGENGVSSILEEMGPGVCVADYDGDGYPDIYFVNGRDRYNRKIETRNALYHNNGDGTFSDVTESAHVPGSAYGLGCIWGDYDNDGFPDLYVSQYGKNILYRNHGDGTFEDATANAHVDGTDFGTVFHSGATFFDYDRDGFLDLFVGGYANFAPGSQKTCAIGYGVIASCRPSVYGGTAAVLYHNNRNGTFSNVTKAVGIYQPKGLNLSVGAADYDNDGWPDLFVANDGLEAYLYHNDHHGRFSEIALTSGMALSSDGAAMAAMCISLGDYDNDGNLDLYISDFQGVPDHVWRNDGHGFFEEVSERVGIAALTKGVLSFGGGFFDYDNDGWLDLMIANGHVYPGVEKTDPAIHYKQLNSLFHNNGKGRFVETTANGGEAFETPYSARGVAFFDYDNDGKVDFVIGNAGDPPLLAHNENRGGNQFVNFKLVGTKSNRDAMGARLRLQAGGITQIREIAGGGSYLSQSDLRAHFGLGGAQKIDRLEVTWPSGAKQIFRDLAAGEFYLIMEGQSEIGRQKFRTAKP